MRTIGFAIIYSFILKNYCEIKGIVSAFDRAYKPDFKRRTRKKED
jgi:hypothetical protein